MTAKAPRLARRLPVKYGLTPHGLRHSHKTRMAEDGIPKILAEQRLSHEVPGMRGLYAHAKDRMRDDLEHALQAGWEESLRARAAIDTRSPVPLLDELLAPFRGGGRQNQSQRHHARRSSSRRHRGTGRTGQGDDDLPNSSQPCRKPQPRK
jgi:hypothetical protein